jgi:hypothetical protein
MSSIPEIKINTTGWRREAKDVLIAGCGIYAVTFENPFDLIQHRLLHFQGTRPFFECRNRANCMAVFYSGYVATQQSCPPFDGWRGLQLLLSL